MRTLVLLGCLAASLPLSAQSLPQKTTEPAAQRQTPSFKSGVDLVTVDVHAVDGSGRPIENLRPEDFAIVVDGKPRPIVTADYVSYPKTEGTVAAPTIVPRPSPRFSSNSSTLPSSSDRTVYLVLDEANIRIGGGRTAAGAAERFLDELRPTDRVGILTIPAGPAGIDPTTDRGALKTALRSVVGHMVPMETKMDQVYSLAVSEAFSFLHDKQAWSRIVHRECEEKARPQNCPQEMSHYAQSMIDDARQRMRETVRSFASLLKGMSTQPGPKTVVFVSEELPIAPYLTEQRDFLNEAREVTVSAARAQASVYVLHLNSQFFDVESRLESHATSADANMQAQGLEALTSMTGGRRMMVAGRSDTAFSRVALEISGHYLLGFQAQPGDRDGKAHEIKVSVMRGGVDVRARKAFAFAEATSAASTGKGPTGRTATDTVNGLLRSGDPASALPIAVATYTVANPASDRVRVIISAEVGTGAAGPAALTIGYALTDATGRNAGASVETVTLKPAAGHPDSPLCYTGAAVVAPGAYSLRFVAADASLSAGSVVHRFDARLREAASMAVSDLIVLDPHSADAGRPRPSVAAVVDDTLTGYVEVYPTAGSAQSELTGRLELAENESGPAIAFGAMNITGGEGRTTATGWVPTDALPEGDYVARATIYAAGKPAATVSRPVRIAHKSTGSDL